MDRKLQALVGVYRLILLLFTATAFGADLNLVMRAQADFDRVIYAAMPQLRDLGACIQSESALLPVAAPMERSLLHYRKGYCLLIDARLEQDADGYPAAFREFSAGIKEWPPLAGPVSSGLRVLAAIARLGGGTAVPDGVEAELEQAVQSRDCPEGIMPEQRCRELANVGRLWLAWMAYGRGDLEQANAALAGAPDSGWRLWLAAVRQKSVSGMETAIATWNSTPAGSPAALIGPPPDMPRAWYELALAKFGAGDFRGALTADAESLKLRPRNAAALFLRARAEESLGNTAQAMSNYDLATRAAFADPDAPPGQAHLYRGIWLYRRGSIPAAEEEFSSGLNLGAGAFRKEIDAWRHMAAVREGACEDSASRLESALSSVSPLFPSQEARNLLSRCSNRTLTRR